MDRDAACGTIDGHVPLSSNTPEWVALCDALAQLAQRAGAANVVVMDGFNSLWARAYQLDPSSQQHGFDLLAQVLTRPLQLGGHVNSSGLLHFAESFATVYVLILWFEVPFDERWVRAAVRRAMPTIEQLTTSLPPPDGPGSLANSNRNRPA